MTRRFRKKPVVIEAAQWNGKNLSELSEWSGREWDVVPDGEVNLLAVLTLEGVMFARPGDWIIRGVAGEFYPCKPAIFAETYEAVGQ